MFVPLKTTERFDRALFNGSGRPVILEPKTGFTALRYYFKTDRIVGMINGIVDALIYDDFLRDGWYPVEITHGSESYCGWVQSDLVNIK